MALFFGKKGHSIKTELPVVYLVIEGSMSSGRVFNLKQGENLIGRWDPDAGAFPDIDLELDDPEYKISRKHAIIHYSEQGLSIQDLNSLNGTYINRGARLDPKSFYELNDGDELVLGKTFLRLRFNFQ